MESTTIPLKQTTESDGENECMQEASILKQPTPTPTHGPWKCICILFLIFAFAAVVMTIWWALTAIHRNYGTSYHTSQQLEASSIMQQLMQNNNSYNHFTPQQQSNFIRAFNIFDEDHDQYLNETEFINCFQYLLDHSKVFETVDVDSDGTLSYAECVAYLHEIRTILPVQIDLITKMTRPIVIHYGFEIEHDHDLIFLEYVADLMYFEEFDIHLDGHILKTDYLSISAQNQFISVDANQDNQISASELSNMLYGDESHNLSHSWPYKLKEIFGDELDHIMSLLHGIQITPETVANITQRLQLSPFALRNISSDKDSQNANKEHICFANSYCYYSYSGQDAKDPIHVYDPPTHHEPIEGIFIGDINHYLDALSDEETQTINAAQSACNTMQCCRPNDNDYDAPSLCISYGYLQCISSTNECIWECTLPQSDVTKHSIRYRKVFKGVDRHNANGLDHPQTTKDKEDVTIDSMDGDYLAANVMDTCGTVYQYKLKDTFNKADMNTLHHNQIMSHEADGHRRLKGMTPSGEMSNDLRRKLGVIGSDGRRSITRWQSPYYKNVLLTFSAREGTYRCSGALISPRHVLTAGHCVSDGAGNFYWDWTAYPSWNAGNTGTYFKYSHVWVFGAWHYSYDWNWDIAIITLDVNDTGYGWFSFGYSDDISVANWFGVTGYPNDKGYVMQHQWMKMDYDMTEHLMRTRTGDIVSGNSGGPAWLYPTRVVYGVVSHETYTSFVPKVFLHNALARITQPKYEAMCAYLRLFNETAGHCP
eukprot:45054_1